MKIVIVLEIDWITKEEYFLDAFKHIEDARKSYKGWVSLKDIKNSIYFWERDLK